MKIHKTAGRWTDRGLIYNTGTLGETKHKAHS